MVNKQPPKFKRNKSAKHPGRFIVFDTESRVIKNQHALRLGYAFYFEKPRKKKEDTRWDDCAFETARDFWDFVEEHLSQRSRLVITAYNLHFDLRAVNTLNELERRGFEVKAYEKSKWDRTSRQFVQVTTTRTAKRGLQTLLFVDMMQPGFRGSIETLGRGYRIPKRKRPRPNASDVQWLMYCKRDVEIAVQHWLKWGDVLLYFWFLEQSRKKPHQPSPTNHNIS